MNTAELRDLLAGATFAALYIAAILAAIIGATLAILLMTCGGFMWLLPAAICCAGVYGFVLLERYTS